ncbi:MAG: DUF4870 domain-containing protein [Leifsonia sp.]
MTDMPPPTNYPTQGQVPMNPDDEKLWATLTHLGGIIFGVLPALIGYLVLKDRGPFVRAHTATALNFQITLLLAYVVGWLTLIFVLGFFILAAAWVVSIVFGIMAALAANKGQPYVYPLAIRFVT